MSRSKTLSLFVCLILLGVTAILIAISSIGNTSHSNLSVRAEAPQSRQNLDVPPPVSPSYKQTPSAANSKLPPSNIHVIESTLSIDEAVKLERSRALAGEFESQRNNPTRSVEMDSGLDRELEMAIRQLEEGKANSTFDQRQQAKAAEYLRAYKDLGGGAANLLDGLAAATRHFAGPLSPKTAELKKTWEQSGCEAIRGIAEARRAKAPTDLVALFLRDTCLDEVPFRSPDQELEAANEILLALTSSKASMNQDSATLGLLIFSAMETLKTHALMPPAVVEKMRSPKYLELQRRRENMDDSVLQMLSYLEANGLFKEL